MKKWLIRGVLVLVVALGAHTAYTYIRGGYLTAPPLEQGDFRLSFKNGLRAMMREIHDDRPSRKYLAVVPLDVPRWYEKAWAECRPPFLDELARFEAGREMGPGMRTDAICEINADGDVFVRGWVLSVPRL